MAMGPLEGDDGQRSFLLSSNGVWKDQDVRRTGFLQRPHCSIKQLTCTPYNCQLSICTMRTLEVSPFYVILLPRGKKKY